MGGTYTYGPVWYSNVLDYLDLEWNGRLDLPGTELWNDSVMLEPNHAICVYYKFLSGNFL